MRELGVLPVFFRVRTFQRSTKKKPGADFLKDLLKVRKDFKVFNKRAYVFRLTKAVFFARWNVYN